MPRASALLVALLISLMVYQAALAASTWTREAIDTSSSDAFADPAITVDIYGDPHVVYWASGESGLKYAHHWAGAWTLDTIADGSDGVIDTDSNGSPHVAYSTGDLVYATWSASTWDSETIAASDSSSEWPIDLVVDSQDRPHILYRLEDASFTFYLKYTRKTSGSWSAPQTVGCCYPFAASLAIDSDDYPHVIRDSGTLDIDYGHETASGWTWEYSVLGEEITGEVADLRLDGDDNPRIVFIGDDGGGESELKYAFKSGGTWTVEAVGDSTPVPSAARPSLALTSSGKPVIAYTQSSDYPNPPAILKYAWKTTFVWDTEAVDNQASKLFTFPQLVIDAYDNPYVVYLDDTTDTDDDVRIAVGGVINTPHRYQSICSTSVTRPYTRPACADDFHPDVIRLCGQYLSSLDVLDSAYVDVTVNGIQGLPIQDAEVMLYEQTGNVNIVDTGTTTDTTDEEGHAAVSLFLAGGFGLVGLCVDGVTLCEWEVRSPDVAYTSKSCDLPTSGGSWVNAYDFTNTECGYNVHFGVVTPGINNAWDLNCDGVVNATDVNGSKSSVGALDHWGHGQTLGSLESCSGAFTLRAPARAIGEAGVQEDGQRRMALERLPKREAAETDLNLWVRPNPMSSGAVEIAFGMSAPRPVDLTVYSVAGRRVRSLLVNTVASAKTNIVVWNGLNDDGDRVPAGTYFVRLESRDGSNKHERVVVVR